MIVLVIACVQLTSCASIKSRKVVQNAVEAVEQTAPDQKTYFNVDSSGEPLKREQERQGSLWVDNYSSRLYDNMYRAAKVGDTVTIVVSESARAKGLGNTKANRKTDHTASIDELGGLMQKIAGVISTFSPSQIIGAKTDSKYQGDASTEREGELNARITARVTQLLTNGNMLIRGEQHIKINKEEQVLIVEGIIRPYDILPDNTIPSNALADARISYTGFGVVADKQSPGWLVRVLDKVWPF